MEKTTELITMIEAGLETGRARCADQDLYDEVATIRTGMAALTTYRARIEALEAFVAKVAKDAPQEKQQWFSTGEYALYDLGQEARKLLAELKGE